MTKWDEVCAASNEQILAWAEGQAWARAMAGCQQDAQWHAEGDVWTHTRMVAQELEHLDDWSSLDRGAQLTLLFTALFHDAGKPATTQVDAEGRTRSPKHSLVGMELARSVLRDLGCDLATREKIANLVRYHGRPPYLMEKADPAHELIFLSWLVNHRLLFLFALADTRGRTTHDTQRSEENLHLWKMVAEENGCFEQPYAFANDHARFLFYRGGLSSLHYVPREDYRCTVTLMSGLPGAGKDTWLAAHRPDLPVVSLDGIRTTLDIEPTDNQGEAVQQGREECRVPARHRLANATNIIRQIRLDRPGRLRRGDGYLSAPNSKKERMQKKVPRLG